MNKSIIKIITILLVVIIIVQIVSAIKNEKQIVVNSVLLFWDIHCKINIIQFLNDNTIEYKIINVKQDVGVVIKVRNNYYILMEKHPQEYDNIHILLDSIIELIQNVNATSIISIATAGSTVFNIGTVLQFNSALIQNFKEYSLKVNYVKGDKLLIKTENYIDTHIDDTKGFIPPLKNQVAAGQDEFVTFIVSNRLQIPSLSLTGISDNNNPKQYIDGGGELSAKNAITFLFNNVNLLA